MSTIETPVSFLGLVEDLPAELYHSIDAIGSTSLKQLSKSPAHCFSLCIDSQRPRIEATPAMKNGTLVHCCVLEPDEVASRYVVKPAGMSFATTIGKTWRGDQDPKLEIVSYDEMHAARMQAKSLRALPEIAALFESGQAESSAFAVDEKTGLLCKARPDWLTPTGRGAVVLDVKTTVDASPDGFAKAVANLGYALQQTHYEAVIEQASDVRVAGFVFACVENSYPYVAAAYMLSEDWLAYARSKRRELLELYQRCKSAGEWPGYGDTVELIEMPRWLRSA